jgi:hypothetical protein
MDLVPQQVVIGAFMAYVLQWLKKWPPFPVLTEKANRWVKVIFSGVVAAGTVFALEVDYTAVGGILTVAGLTWDNMWNGLLSFGLSFLTQHVTYETVIRAGVAANKRVP